MAQIIINNKSSNSVYTALLCTNSPDNIQLPVLGDFSPREAIVTTGGFSNKAHIFCLEPKGENFVLLCMWNIDASKTSKPNDWAIYNAKTNELVNSNFKSWKATVTNDEKNYFITIADGPFLNSITQNTPAYSLFILIILIIFVIFAIMLWKIFSQ
jgi:hypothetical protein